MIIIILKEKGGFTHSYLDGLIDCRLTALGSEPNKLNINRSLFVHKDIECYDMLAMSKNFYSDY